MSDSLYILIMGLISTKGIGVLQPILQDEVNGDIHDDVAQVVSAVALSGLLGFLMALPRLQFGASPQVWGQNWLIFFAESQVFFWGFWRGSHIRLMAQQKGWPATLEYIGRRYRDFFMGVWAAPGYLVEQVTSLLHPKRGTKKTDTGKV